MHHDDGLRGFLALTFPRSVSTTLERVQHEVAQSAKHGGCQIKLLPKQTLTLPLEDLGAPPPESYEALDLAVERALRDTPRFQVGFTNVDVWTPQGGGAGLVRLMVGLGIEALVDLRARLHHQLSRYGFSTTLGDWKPHIPLAQVVDGAYAVGAIKAPLDSPFEVRDISVLCQRFNAAGRSRFRIRKKFPVPSDTALLNDRPEPLQLSEAIGKALDERLAALPATQPKIKQRKHQRALNDDVADGDNGEDQESDLVEEEVAVDQPS